MAAIETTFIVLSSILLIYLINAIISKKRVPLVTELLYLCMYAVSALFFFYPRVYTYLDTRFGIQLLLLLFLVIGFFLLFATCVRLYQKLDALRVEITNLTRVIALTEQKKKK